MIIFLFRLFIAMIFCGGVALIVEHQTGDRRLAELTAGVLVALFALWLL
jgi:hypothetical protein